MSMSKTTTMPHKVRGSAYPDATRFACKIPAISNAQNLAMFSTFRLSNLPTAGGHSSPSTHIIVNPPSLVASNTPLDAPRPLFTSDFHGCCRIQRCRPIPTSGEEKLGIPELRTCSRTCSTNNTLSPPRATKLPIGQWNKTWSCAM